MSNKYVIIIVWLFAVGFIYVSMMSFVNGKNDMVFPVAKITNFSNSGNKIEEKVSLDLEGIFLNQNKEEGNIVLIATGDIIPARSVNFQTTSRGDFRWPYEKTGNILWNADITFINLETPLLTSCPVTNEGMIFCGDKRNVEGLRYVGVDVVNLANNHAGNYGKTGIDETIGNLEKEGILVTGANNGVAIKEVKGVKFGFLGYNDIGEDPVVSKADEGKMTKEINETKGRVDVLVVAFHWGAEYQSQPDLRQRELGKLAIDSGADLVIGNHPHWIQPIEFYQPRVVSGGRETRKKLITYAHGNFIFDQEWSQKTKEGVVGKYFFNDKQLVGVEYLPVEIKDFGQPYFLEGERRKNILDYMYQESLRLKN